MSMFLLSVAIMKLLTVVDRTGRRRHRADKIKATLALLVSPN